MAIKGQYVARVVLDFDLPNDKPGLLPFEQIREQMLGDTITNTLRNCLNDGFDTDEFEITVCPESAFVEQTEDEPNENP